MQSQTEHSPVALDGTQLASGAVGVGNTHVDIAREMREYRHGLNKRQL